MTSSSSLPFPSRRSDCKSARFPGAKKDEPVPRYFQEIRLLVAAFSESRECLGAYEKKFFLDLDEAQMQQLRLGSATVDRTMSLASSRAVEYGFFDASRLNNETWLLSCLIQRLRGPNSLNP